VPTWKLAEPNVNKPPEWGKLAVAVNVLLVMSPANVTLSCMVKLATDAEAGTLNVWVSPFEASMSKVKMPVAPPFVATKALPELTVILAPEANNILPAPISNIAPSPAGAAVTPSLKVRLPLISRFAVDALKRVKVCGAPLSVTSLYSKLAPITAVPAPDTVRLV